MSPRLSVSPKRFHKPIDGRVINYPLAVDTVYVSRSRSTATATATGDVNQRRDQTRHPDRLHIRFGQVPVQLSEMKEGEEDAD